MNDKNKHWSRGLFIGAAVGAGAIWFIRRRLGKLAWLPTWQRVLTQRHGTEKAKQYVEAIQKNFATLLGAAALPANPALRRHLMEHILPGLALYQVLLPEHAHDRQAALAEVDEVFRAWTYEKMKLVFALMKILPLPFSLFKLAVGFLMKSFPAEGWDFTPVENSSTRLAFNATRCFYLNTLTALGAPELTASFCKSDDVLAELFPASLRFVRPHTLGRGDTLCDFQYCQVKPAHD
jgi:hypothetical protein